MTNQISDRKIYKWWNIMKLNSMVIKIFYYLKEIISKSRVIPFKETFLYKVFLSPLIKVSFSLVGDTMPIWGSGLVSLLFIGILPINAWPGLAYFITDGTIIVISFAFLSNALYYSTRSLKINVPNTISILLLIASMGLFTRAIGLKLSGGKHDCDKSVYIGSILIFIFSLMIYYIIIANQKYKQVRSNLSKERTKEEDTLEGKYRQSKDE
jgi:hypothetical protein